MLASRVKTERLRWWRWRCQGLGRHLVKESSRVLVLRRHCVIRQRCIYLVGRSLILQNWQAQCANGLLDLRRDAVSRKAEKFDKLIARVDMEERLECFPTRHVRRARIGILTLRDTKVHKRISVESLA